MKTVKRISFVFAFFFLPYIVSAANSKAPLIIEKLKHQQLVDKFYETRGTSLFWFNADQQESLLLRQKAKMLFDSAIYLGLDKQRYHYDWISANIIDDSSLQDSLMRLTADRIYTDALITFCKDIYGGAELNSWLGYDEVRVKFETLDNSYILTGLSVVSSPVELDWFIRFLEPNCDDYLNLKNQLKEVVLTNNDTCAVKQLSQSLNVLRWIKHYRFSDLTARNVSEEMQLLCSWLW